MRILVVDDSLVMRRLITKELTEAGLGEVDQVNDGSEAVTAVAGKHYDIVLMDWNMPNMLGIEALQVIRASGSKVPIIMVTTEAEKSRIIDAIKSGANNYLVKPFKSKALVQKIQEVMAAVQ